MYTAIKRFADEHESVFNMVSALVMIASAVGLFHYHLNK